jgi:hypothetical protein
VQNLDLEFYREENPQIGNPVLMVSQFIQMVCEMFKKLFKVHLDPERNFLILDSSNDEKFSAHVIGKQFYYLFGFLIFIQNISEN